VAELQVLDRPKINRVEPALTCLADKARMLDIHGEGFVKIESSDPTIMDQSPTASASQINVQAEVDTVDNCETIYETSATTVMSCTHLQVRVDGDETGTAEIDIENPMPVGCGTDGPGTVRVAAAPTVSSAEPAPSSTCSDANNFRRVVVTGDNFLKKDGRLPAVQVGRSRQPIIPRAANNCTDVPDTGEANLEHCQELIVYVQTDTLDQGRELSVQNPPPSSCRSGQTTVQACP
jgi:hypothetical protein